MRYALHDRVVYGLLALADDKLRQLHGVIEAIAAQPVEAAHAAGFDNDGRKVFVYDTAEYRLLYFIMRDGRVVFTELVALRTTGSGR
jgi:hypothetical protein